MSPKTKKDELSSPRSDENNPNQKPPFSYAQLIIQAISTAPERQELVEQIPLILTIDDINEDFFIQLKK